MCDFGRGWRDASVVQLDKCYGVCSRLNDHYLLLLLNSNERLFFLSLLFPLFSLNYLGHIQHWEDIAGMWEMSGFFFSLQNSATEASDYIISDAICDNHTVLPHIIFTDEICHESRLRIMSTAFCRLVNKKWDHHQTALILM